MGQELPNVHSGHLMQLGYVGAPEVHFFVIGSAIVNYY
jgi:hypothetical protein